jgi:hypothetical protein
VADNNRRFVFGRVVAFGDGFDLSIAKRERTTTRAGVSQL